MNPLEAFLRPLGDWVEDALCRQVDADIFYPEKGGAVGEAKRICRGCPVKLECLAEALENDERFGVWGGYSERERRKMKPRNLNEPKLASA